MRAVLIVPLVVVTVIFLRSTVAADDHLDEAKAVAKIELLGGSVIRAENDPGRPVIGIDLHRSKRFNNKYQYLLKSFPSLVSLNLECSSVTDDHIQ